MLFIEGVGGIMVPLDAKRTVLDWMAALNIPLLLVVGGYLGAISHTLTALDVLAQRKLKIAAIVVSESERGTVELDDTVASIARFSNGVDVIGLPRLPGGLNQHPAFAQIAALYNGRDRVRRCHCAILRVDVWLPRLPADPSTGLCADCCFLRREFRIYVSHFWATKVSSMPSRLISACSRIVNMVEPVHQRIQPSSRPNAKIWPVTYQSYCT